MACWIGHHRSHYKFRLLDLSNTRIQSFHVCCQIIDPFAGKIAIDSQKPLSDLFRHSAEINEINRQTKNEGTKICHRYTNDPDDDAIQEKGETRIAASSQNPKDCCCIVDTN